MALIPPGVTHRFTRWAQYGNISSSTATFNNFTWKFALSDLPNYTEFTTLFDQYRITAIEMLFVPTATESVSTTPINGCFFAVIDYDDATSLSTNTDYLQYDTFQQQLLVMPASSVKKIKLRPRLATAVYGGGAFTSYANTVSWLDVASPSVEHYGVKVGLAATPVTTIGYQVLARYELEFKHAR